MAADLGHALPAGVKVAAALAFHTVGTYRAGAGADAGTSQASVSQDTAALARRLCLLPDAACGEPWAAPTWP